MTRMTGPDCAVMCNLINTHTHIHTHSKETKEETQGIQGVSKNCPSKERECVPFVASDQRFS